MSTSGGECHSCGSGKTFLAVRIQVQTASCDNKRHIDRKVVTASASFLLEINRQLPITLIDFLAILADFCLDTVHLVDINVFEVMRYSAVITANRFRHVLTSFHKKYVRFFYSSVKEFSRRGSEIEPRTTASAAIVAPALFMIVQTFVT